MSFSEPVVYAFRNYLPVTRIGGNAAWVDSDANRRRDRPAEISFCIAIYDTLLLSIHCPMSCLFRVSPTDTRITNTIILLSDRRYPMKSPRLELLQGAARGVLPRDFRE